MFQTGTIGMFIGDSPFQGHLAILRCHASSEKLQENDADIYWEVSLIKPGFGNTVLFNVTALLTVGTFVEATEENCPEPSETRRLIFNHFGVPPATQQCWHSVLCLLGDAGFRAVAESNNIVVEDTYDDYGDKEELKAAERESIGNAILHRVLHNYIVTVRIVERRREAKKKYSAAFEAEFKVKFSDFFTLEKGIDVRKLADHLELSGVTDIVGYIKGNRGEEAAKMVQELV